MTKEDALDMDERFVTNSLMGVMPVNALGETRYFRGMATRSCMEAYASSCKVL